MILALASIVAVASVPQASTAAPRVECRLEDGRFIPCEKTRADLLAHPEDYARAAVAFGHDYHQEARSLTLSCNSAPEGSCHFRLEEGGRQRHGRIKAGKTIVVRNVGWSARLCVDCRARPGLCHGSPVTPPPAAAPPRRA